MSGFARKILILLLIGIGWCTHRAATAQTVVKLRASPPNVEEFPSIHLSLSLTDNEGKHISGLDSGDFLVLEDGQPIHGVQVEESEVGTRQVFAVNSSRGMRSRDALGMTRFDYVRQSLIQWFSQTEAASVGWDDLTLLTTDGPLIEHSSVAAELAAGLFEYEPEYIDESPSFDMLLQALQYAADPAPRPGMPTHIFFITPLILRPDEIPLADTIARAKDNGITIYPILVGPEEILDYPEIEDLRLLAEETGGELIIYDSTVGLSFLPERVLSQRMLYLLTFESQANSAGAHRIQIQATQAGFDVLSNQQTYEIQLLPPIVSLTEVPQLITRQSEDATLAVEQLPPQTWPLDVQIAFPDGHIRPIVSSSLIVDDQIVDQNVQSPFDHFTWPLDSYTHTDNHLVQILIEDSLGLQGFSNQAQVAVEVITPPSGLSAIQPALGNFLMILGIIVVGLVISVGAISVTRQRRNASISPQPADRPDRKSRSRATLRQGSRLATVEARMEAISPQAPSFPLVGTDIILGRDAALSAVHLDDPSVSGLHARLTRLASGDYLVRDQGSTSGTWVNFSPVPESGVLLHHGDMIHIGRISYRFFLAHPPPPRKISISPAEGAAGLPSKTGPEGDEGEQSHRTD